MSQKQSTRQSRQHGILPMVGNAADEALDLVLSKIDAQLGKLFEDRNLMLSGGGIITNNSTGTSLSFTSAFVLYVNQNVAGASPYAISISSSPWSFSVDGNMAYVVINRTAQTATLTTNSSTLPSATSSNQEVVMIAKRVGTSIFLMGGSNIASGASRALGRVGTAIDTEFAINDSTDATKQIKFDAAGTTNTSTTIASSQTSNRVLTLPDATDTLIGKATTDVLTNKDIDGGTASNTSRITLPKDTKTNLDALTRKQATLVYATDNNKVYYDDGSTLKAVGSGTGTSINYIANPDAEDNTSGWTTYSDTQNFTVTIASPAVFTATNHGLYLGQPISFSTTGALPTGLTIGTTYYVSAIPTASTYRVSATLGGADVNTSGTQSGTHSHAGLTPITGAGAGPLSGINFVRTTSSPLRGVASFKLYKNASVQTAGQGVAYAFTIDSADKAKVLSISFDYNAASDFTASAQLTIPSDVQVYVYDVTNSALIPVIGNQITSNGPANFTFNGQFQTSANSTSYRLILHSATTASSISGKILTFDNVSVSPVLIQNATSASEVQVVGGNGFGSGNTVRRFSTQLVSIGAAITYTDSSTNGASFTINEPGYYSINYFDLAGTTSSTDFYITRNQTGISTANDLLSGQYVVGASSSVSCSWEGLLAAGDIIRATVGDKTRVTSNAAVAKFTIVKRSIGIPSSDADVRVVAARAVDAAGQSIPTGSTTIINFNTPSFDTHSGIITGASWKYTAQVPGFYKINAILNLATAAGGGSLYAYIYKNGSQVSQNFTPTSATAYPYAVTINDTISLNAGDYIDIRALQNAGASRSLIASASFVSVERIAGPAAISATETIAASYYCSATQAASTTTPINFDTKEYDTHGAVTTGSGWRFTAPASGLFTITALGNPTVNAVTTLMLYKNGSVYKTISSTPNASGAISSGSVDVRLNAGEYVDVRPNASQSVVGGSLSSAGTSHVSIKRIGL